MHACHNSVHKIPLSAKMIYSVHVRHTPQILNHTHSGQAGQRSHIIGHPYHTPRGL